MSLRQVLPLALLAAAALPTAAGAAEHPPAGALSDGTVLVVQQAPHGTYADGRLVLRGVSPRATWLADDERRIAGRVPVADMHAGIFDAPDPTPDGAVALTAADGRRRVVPIELRSGRYHPRSDAVTYRIRPTARLREVSLAHLRSRVTGRPIPRVLRNVTVFAPTSSHRTCTVELVNRTGAALTLQSAVKWDTDDWADPAPLGTPPVADGASIGWRTIPSFYRGCHNEVTWTVGGEGGATIRVERTLRMFGADEPNTCTSSDPAYVCVRFRIRNPGLEHGDVFASLPRETQGWTVQRAGG